MALRDKKTFVGAPSGFPSSMLSRFWEDAFLNDRDTSKLWPFKGKRQLPTQGQVLSMYFYIRGLEKMSKVSRSVIMDLVGDQVVHCSGVNISHFPQIFIWGKVLFCEGSGEEFDLFEAEIHFFLYKCLIQAQIQGNV